MYLWLTTYIQVHLIVCVEREDERHNAEQRTSSYEDPAHALRIAQICVRWAIQSGEKIQKSISNQTNQNNFIVHSSFKVIPSWISCYSLLFLLVGGSHQVEKRLNNTKCQNGSGMIYSEWYFGSGSIWFWVSSRRNSTFRKVMRNDRNSKKK